MGLILEEPTRKEHAEKLSALIRAISQVDGKILLHAMIKSPPPLFAVKHSNI